MISLARTMQGLLITCVLRRVASNIPMQTTAKVTSTLRRHHTWNFDPLTSGPSTLHGKQRHRRGRRLPIPAPVAEGRARRAQCRSRAREICIAPAVEAFLLRRRGRRSSLIHYLVA
mmetsp:Transcript_53014/g.119420  ORF Transcript_53014/g.119420 Transcript_53014/m.119420 type:complete len:116 (-) Transcript_53014:36-383(-)